MVFMAVFVLCVYLSYGFLVVASRRCRVLRQERIGQFGWHWWQILGNFDGRNLGHMVGNLDLI